MIKKNLLCLIPSLTTIIFSVVGGLFLSKTQDYKIDKFSSFLFNNTIYANNTYDNVIFNVKKTKPLIENDKLNSYNDLFKVFHNTAQVACERIVFDNRLYDKTTCDFKLLTQPSFSIIDNQLKSGCYPLDYGDYSTYFCDDILGSRGYLNPRFGCDGFVFISDQYARYLIEYYNIPFNESNPKQAYETLILNKDYCVLEVNEKYENVSKLSINNIINCKDGLAPKTSDIYGFFGLTYVSTSIDKWASLSFEIDLKSNPYLTKQDINAFLQYGMNLENTKFSFMKYDNSSNEYIPFEEANSKFLTLGTSNSILFIILFFINALILIVLLFVFYLKVVDLKIINLSVLLLALSFIIYGIIVSFISIYYLISLIPILAAAVVTIMCFEEIANDFRILFSKIIKKKNN